MTYFNTTSLSGNELKENVKKAKAQTQIVLEFFKSNPGQQFTPPEVQVLCGLQDSPLTSIRRAITTLTKSGELINTLETAPGKYGAPNFKWRLNQKYKQLNILNP